MIFGKFSFFSASSRFERLKNAYKKYHFRFGKSQTMILLDVEPTENLKLIHKQYERDKWIVTS